MNLRTALVALTVSSTLFGPLPAAAEVPAGVKAEVDHLIAFIGESGCEFYRNGSWYDGKKGQSHVSDKYTWLLGRDMIQTTNDFIDKAATQSSMSNQAYQVRCKGGEPIASAKWLSDELSRFRLATKAGGNTMIAKTSPAAPAPVGVTQASTGSANALVAKPSVKVN